MVKAASLKQKLRLYLVTDRRLSQKIGKTIFEVAEEACAAGVRVVQYRGKELDPGIQIAEALLLRAITQKHGALFIVNDHPNLAEAVGADGVHLGQGDVSIRAARRILGKGRIIGASTHSLEQAFRAKEDGADYIGVGPVFATSTKADAGKPVGLELVSRVKKAVRVPLVAIGGINSTNLASVFSAGADGAAMVSEFVKKKSVAKTVNALKIISHGA